MPSSLSGSGTCPDASAAARSGPTPEDGPTTEASPRALNPSKSRTERLQALPRARGAEAASTTAPSDTLGIEQGVRDAHLSDINADLINVHPAPSTGPTEHAVNTLAEHDYTVRDAFNDGT